MTTRVLTTKHQAFGRKDGAFAAIEGRLDALRRKCTTGYGCGSSCISVQKECRSKPVSAMGRERIKRLQQLARGEIKPRGLGVPTGTEASGLAADLEGRRAARAAELAAKKTTRSATPVQAGGLASSRPGSTAIRAQVVGNASSLAKPQQVAPAQGTPRISDVMRETLNAMKAIDARQMARTAENLFEAGWSLDRRTKYKGMSKEQAREKFKAEFLRQMEKGSGAPPSAGSGARDRTASFGSVAGAMRSLISEMKGQDERLADLENSSIDLRVRAKNLEMGGSGEPLELTSPSRVGPQIKPAGKAGGLNAQDVSTAKQQVEFARQQRQAAMAAGDQQGADAWRQEERAVARARVQAAARRAQQRQTSLLGVAEYDESLPLFGRKDGAIIGGSGLDAAKQVAAMRLELERAGLAPKPATREAATASMFDSSAPTGMALLEVLEDRMDAMRRRCSIGYGCGSACISLRKECRVTPMSAVSQRRLKRLMNLAAGGASARVQERKSPTERKIAALNTARDQLGKNLVASLSRQRPDGQGNFIEHPDAAAWQQIKSAGLRVAKLDRQLNVLEGKDPDEKRWIEGDPYGLARYSDFQSPGRKAYERKVIARELKGATVGDQAVFMSGGPASGKTSLLKRQFGDAKGFAVIDPDRIKGYDPVMEIGVAMGMRKAAELAHENSSRLSKKVYNTALDRGFNVLMDGTGANADKYIGQMQELRGKGYQITLLAQHVSEEVGVTRALGRADRTGRYVPLEFIKHAYEVIPGNFERIARVADRATLNDGESDQVIMQYQAGRLVGGSRQQTANYRKRYGKH